MSIFGRRVSDTAVLDELRLIRAEIQHLSERMGNTPTRQELVEGYVSKDQFNTLVSERERASWLRTLPIWLSAAAVLWAMVGPYVHVGVGK